MTTQSRPNFKIFGVGTGRTGTHSLAAIYGDRLRSAHEPENRQTINLLKAYHTGEITRHEFTNLLEKRAHRLALDVDISQLNFFILDFLLTRFDHSRFILTIRDCQSWLDSTINHALFHGNPGEEWTWLRDFRFRPDLYPHPAEEEVLRHLGFYSLEGYFRFWTQQIQTVVKKVPPKRLLIVRTEYLSESVDSIADFSGIHRSVMVKEQSLQAQGTTKYGVLRKLPREYFQEMSVQYCGEIMARFFPDISMVY